MLPSLRRLVVYELSHSRLPFRLALVAVALALPSLGVGWQLDDLFQRETFLGQTAHLSPWEAFSTLRGDPALLRTFIDSGAIPWWTPEDFRLAFFRFLSVATHRLDYALWPDSPALMHVQSLVWYGLMVAAATALYRRVLGAGWVAGLAALAFALDDAHVLPAAWIANRNAVQATLFGLLCLVAHDRWRRDGWRPGAWLGPLALALALAASELALSTLAYMAAYVLFLDPTPWRRRLAGLVPYGAVAALWAGAYKLLGFGVSGSGWYIEPATSPGRFVVALAHRAPFLLLGQWTGFPADAGGVLAPRFPPGMWFYAVGFVVVLVLLLVPLLRRNAAARFLAIGMFLCLVPIAGAVPQNRELLFVGFGGMGLFAQIVQGAFTGAPWVPAWRPWWYAERGFVVLFLPVHLVLAPLVGPLQIAMWRDLAAPAETAVGSLPTDAALADQDLIVVNAPDYLYFVSYPPPPPPQRPARSAPRSRARKRALPGRRHPSGRAEPGGAPGRWPVHRPPRTAWTPSPSPTSKGSARCGAARDRPDYAPPRHRTTPGPAGW